MSKPEVKSFSDLVDKEMKTKDCLNGYDVLVSYSQQELSDRVNTHLAKTGLTLSFSCDVSAGWSGTTKWQNEWSLKNTKVSIASDGFATFIFDLSGSSTQEATKEKHEIPLGVQLSLKSKLTGIKGTYKVQAGSAASSATTDFVGSNKNAAQTPDAIILDPKQDQACAVALDLGKNCVATCIPTGGTDEVKKAALVFMNSGVTKAAIAYMYEQDIILYIAGVTNQSKQGSSSAVQLQPTTFQFTTVEAADPAKSTLCMWISVVGGATNAASSPSFSPDSVLVNPIPDGSTASVVFSHNLMANKFFVVSTS